MTARPDQLVALPSRSYITAAAAAAAHVALAVAMRLLTLWRYRIDSDEPQHLHVVWEWSRGAVAYRDFYDNHLPLFHILFTPLFRAVGETDAILVAARIAMLPLAAAAIALTWRIAVQLYDRTVAFWCALLTAVMPLFLLKSVEFRNDNLWVVGVLGALTILFGRLSARRAFLAGVLLGLTLLVSIKTIHVALALGVALIAVHGLHVIPRIGTAMFGGFAIAPAAAAIWFASKGALDELWLCAIAINGRVAVAPARRAIGLLVFLASIAVAVQVVRRVRGVRAVAAATTALYVGSVALLSPLVSPRDFLAMLPLLMLFATAAALPRLGSAMHALPPLLAVLAVLQGNLLAPPPSYDRRVVAETLALTRPGETVLDLKGETIFRPRATFVAYERVGREMVARGVVAATQPRELVAQRCYVATRDSRFFPPQARRFLSEHYVQIGELRAAGQHVRADGTFAIAIPGEYVYLDQHQRVIGRARRYAAGRYRLPPSWRGRAATVVWAGVQRARRSSL